MEFVEVVTKILARSGKNPQIVERIKGNLFHSVLQHRQESQAVQFFLSFMTGDYTITDFRFFNMLFSFAFKCIYPPVDESLENPDLRDDSTLFFINRNLVDQISLTMLRSKFPALLLNGIRKHPMWTDLISFWQFARHMITLFEDAHRKFHRQIRNILQLIGSSEAESSVTKDGFAEFIHMINPTLYTQDMKDMWERMQLLCKMAEGQGLSAHDMYIRFCGDDPSLPPMIIEMPYLSSFPAVFAGLSEPILILVNFLRKRFFDFLPRYMEALPEEMRDALYPYMKKMRNAFLKCDMATIIVAYRFILQYVDLRCTEAMPYEVLTPALTTDDVNRMINHLMMRECLASLWVKLKAKTQVSDADSIIASEIFLNNSGEEAEQFLKRRERLKSP
jgi:hypothetical protein